MTLRSVTLREAAAAKLAEAKALGEEFTDGVMPAEAQQKMTAFLNEYDGLKVQLEQQLRIEAADAFMNEPAGAKAAHIDWAGEAGPNDGHIKGVSGENGDLYGTNRMGEAKVRTLSSGEYKDAIDGYIRVGGNFARLNPAHQKVLQEGVDTSGGFWVPVDQRSEVVKKMATITGVREDVRRFPTGSDIASFPKVVYTADDQYTAGARFAWTAEAPSAAISETTNPAAGQINIPVHTALCAIVLTRAMIEDSQFDILGYISDLMGETFALQEDSAFISGTGVGQPQGFLSHANATTAHASGGMQILSGASAAMAWGNGTSTGVLGIEAVLPPQYDRAAKWYATKVTYSAVRALNITTAGIQWSLGDSYPNAANGYSPSLLGHPLVMDAMMPAIGASNYPMAFGDMSGYYVAERVGMSIEVLREVQALQDQVVVYGRRRLGGQLVHDWKLKVLKSNNS